MNEDDILNNIVLYDAINNLDDKLQYIIRQRFFENRSQEDVAYMLDASRSLVSRLEKKAIYRLRNSIKEI